ncbi:MAG: helix-turn-helix domain-containing protein [Bacteroidota bacterium]
MTQNVSILNILIAYGALQAIFIAVVLLKTSNRSIFKKLFAFLLIVEGVTLIERLLVETELIHSMPHILGISYPLSFTKPPLMFFMALAITHKGFRISKNTFLHFIPFVLMLLLNLPFYTLDGAEKLNLVRAFMEKVPSYASFDFYFTLSFFVYIGIYIFLCIKRLDHFRSYSLSNALVNWYRKLLLIYSGFLFLHLFYFVIQPLGNFNFDLINQVSMLAMTFIIQAIAYMLIQRSSLTTKTSVPNLGSLEQQKLDEKRILKALEQDKLYLDDELSLKKFSEKICLPHTYVSQIINQKFNSTFKRMINRYRIDEAKQIMESSKDEKIKLIDVGFRSGFNNKVSFYRSFREFENLSPSEYLERIKK